MCSRRTLLWIGAGLASLACLVFGPLLAKVVTEWGRQRGLFDHPEGSAVSASTAPLAYLSALSAQQWYPYLVGIVVGVLLGGGAMWLAQRRQELERLRSAQATQETAKLASEAWIRLNGFLSRQASAPSVAEGIWKPSQSILRTADHALVMSVLGSLKRIGVPTPVMGKNIGTTEAGYLKHYLAAVHPYLAAGQHAKLRREAARVVAEPPVPDADRQLVAEWLATETATRGAK